MAALAFLVTEGNVAADGPAPRLVAGFEDVAPLAIGAEAIVRAPSTATVLRVPDGDGHALEVSGREVPSGVAGVRITFHDGSSRPP